jgi:hypothetical protein
MDDWVALIGLDPAAYGTHNLRRTKVALLYKRTGNPRGRWANSGEEQAEAHQVCRLPPQCADTVYRTLA